MGLALLYILTMVSFFASGYLWGESIVRKGPPPPKAWWRGEMDFLDVPQDWLFNPLLWSLTLQAFFFPGLFLFVAMVSLVSLIPGLMKLLGVSGWLSWGNVSLTALPLLAVGALSTFAGITAGTWRAKQRITRDPEKLREAIRAALKAIEYHLDSLQDLGKFARRGFEKRLKRAMERIPREFSLEPSMSPDEFAYIFRKEFYPKLEQMVESDDVDQLLNNYRKAKEVLFWLSQLSLEVV